MRGPSRTPRPSPLQTLAILQAHAQGEPAAAIERHTGLSNSTVARYWSYWGHEAKALDNLFRRYGIEDSGMTYQDLYPQQSKIVAGMNIQSGEWVAPVHKFKLGFGHK